MIPLLSHYPTYSRRCLKIKAREGGRLIPFQLNHIQQDLVDAVAADDLAGRPARHVVLKFRRPGISTAVAGLFFHRVATRPLLRAIVLSVTADTSKTIAGIYERFYRNLPTINGVNFKPERTGSKGKEITFPKFDSSIVSGSSSIQDYGRGDEAQLLHLSEAGSYIDIEDLLAGLMPTIPKTAGSCVIMESTSKGGDTGFMDFWAATKYGETGWTPHFYGWQADPRNVMPADFTEDDYSEEEKEMAEEYELTLWQVAWRRFTLKTDFAGNEQRFKLEYPMTEEECKCIIGAIIWDQDIIDACYERKKPVLCGDITREGVQKDSQGPLTIWEEPIDGMFYCIGADPAAGLDEEGDLSVANVWACPRNPSLTDRRTWPRQVATWADHISPVAFAQVLTALGYYYKKALISCEVTGLGRGTQDALMKITHYPFLHRWIPWDKYGTHSRTYGWETTPRAKNVMLSIFDWLLRTRRMTYHSPEMYRELLGMRKMGPTTYMGADGDDHFMSAAIGLVSWYQHRFFPTKLTDLQSVLLKTYGGVDPEPAKKSLITQPPVQEKIWTPAKEKQRALAVASGDNW